MRVNRVRARPAAWGRAGTRVRLGLSIGRRRFRSLLVTTGGRALNESAGRPIARIRLRWEIRSSRSTPSTGTADTDSARCPRSRRGVRRAVGSGGSSYAVPPARGDSGGRRRGFRRVRPARPVSRSAADRRILSRRRRGGDGWGNFDRGGWDGWTRPVPLVVKFGPRSAQLATWLREAVTAGTSRVSSRSSRGSQRVMFLLTVGREAALMVCSTKGFGRIGRY